MTLASNGRSVIPAAPVSSTPTPPGGRTAARYSAVRAARTSDSPGRIASLIRASAEPLTASGISSRPSSTGKIRHSSRSARVWLTPVPPGAPWASARWSVISRPTIQLRRSWSSGFHEASGSKTGTASAGRRRDNRSSTRRTSKIVFPAPGSPRTTSRPVGTRSSTSTRPLSVPVSPAGLWAHVPPGGLGQPEPVLASLTSASQSATKPGSAGSHRTDIE